MECSHLLDNVKVDSVLVAVDISITKNFSCSGCGTKEQNWLCLQCGAVNCGRYVNGHAKQHAEEALHQLCMSCDVYSVYCYKCDDYVSNDTETEAIDKIRQSIMKISKSEDADSNIGQHEESSKDGSEISGNSAQDAQSPSPVQSEYTRVPDNVLIATCADIPNVISSTSETSDIKSTKTTKNPEEPARSLRPRSRKRSHSEDSNSTENSTTQQVSKKEKKSPCNGKKDKKIVGLKNLGNTCFMNAVLQSLNNIQEFSCYFSQLPSLEVKTNGRKVYHSRSYTRQEVNEVVMAEELRKVLINLNQGGCGSKGAISPEYLFHVIWKVVPRFRGYQQQDAHEFLRYMLDRLHTELLQLVPGDRVGAEAAGTFVPRARSASIVTAVFGGTLQSEVRCLACGTESKKFDPFLDLSLELPENGRHDEPVPLADCLASFVQVEELADTERYFCSSCKCKQKSTKQFWIRRLPNVLCLHLKRFRWHNNYRNKVDTSISFPLSALDMSRFVPHNVPDTRRSGLSNYLYDLAAVIVHHGSGAGSGHYTAYAINEEQWFHFNDQTVRATHSEAVASCKPYILFYIRRELALPSAL
ncbi:ubiquitin carboxyl-terminal hydrolase 3-like isoform X2 [Hyposmocoma kahamanoa]|uniref:ubiquitin carboxyl-terminal hydrolase 3-like isoform X2 n=1 Tax=Hyposmocoma kahamanoa TaxID=1477025 RepID=UPI000E6D601B|nr:ubiquitin carboxyl-terminal hydrolase 3-like isoform X2 [Hyposmocoma kahamanoa]